MSKGGVASLSDWLLTNYSSWGSTTKRGQGILRSQEVKMFLNVRVKIAYIYLHFCVILGLVFYSMFSIRLTREESK